MEESMPCRKTGQSSQPSKIKQTVSSMKECMRVTEEEQKFRNNEINAAEIDNYKAEFKCTKCGSGFMKQIRNGGTVSEHPLLGVLMCQRCCNFYGDGNFSLDSDGEDKYCRWCGKGGTLFSCSKCICAFCKNCIYKHFGTEILQNVIDDDDWVCYFCNPKPLWHLRNICTLAKDNCCKFEESRKAHLYGDNNDVVKHKSDSDGTATENCANYRKGVEKMKLRRFRGTSYLECLPSSSEEEDVNRLRTRRRRRVKMKKYHSGETGEDTGEAELLNPVKRQKVHEQSVKQSVGTSDVKKNMLLVFKKFQGIWKMTEIVMEIGRNWSRERLEILSKPDAIDTLEVKKEYKIIKSVMAMLSSSINKARDSIEVLKDDLDCRNVKDDRDHFQTEEVRIKRQAKILREYMNGNLSSDESLSLTRPEERKENLEESRSEGDEKEDNNKPMVEIESDFCNHSRSLFSDSEIEAPKVAEDVRKPLLKVKEFAKMTNANIFEEFQNREESDVGNATNKTDQVMDEYNLETEVSSVDDTKSPTLSDRAAKSRMALKEAFEKLREKRCQKLSARLARASSKDSDGEKTDKSTVDRVRKSVRRRKRILSSGDDDEDDGRRQEKDKNDCADDQNSSASDAPSSASSSTSEKQTKKNRNNVLNSKSNEANPSKGKTSKMRRNIKRIFNTNSLMVSTKEALKNETEKKKRLSMRVKLRNELFPQEFDSQGRTKQLVLDFNPATNNPLVTVSPKLVKVLKPHQVEGIRFIWDNCFESVDRLLVDPGSGCILAHCMGLGKTLQVVTFVHTVLNHDLGVNTVLVICPLNTVSNWLKEFETWLKDVEGEIIFLYNLVEQKRKEDRLTCLGDWQKNGGVLVMSYDLFRNLTKGNGQHSFKGPLLNPGPDLVICDEGHLLKNENSRLWQCVNQIQTPRRIVLTGTPLQNNLMEYHCMVQFVRPNILGTRKEFSNQFANPINNGQFEDSTESDVRLMKKRSHVLHNLLSGCVQRRDYAVLTPYLPEKHEYVLSIALTDVQAQLYRHFLDNVCMKLKGTSKSSSFFNDYQNLHRIWTHPRVLLMHQEQVLGHESDRSLQDFVVVTDDDSTSTESSDSDSRGKNPKKKPRSKATRFDAEEAKQNSFPNAWWSKYLKPSDYDDVTASNKLMLLFTLLKKCQDVGDKVLVFSQSLYSLDIIEHFLDLIDDNLVDAFHDTWVAGLDYYRLDGTTSVDMRTKWCKDFNDEDNKRGRLFLISTRAGGLGINLHAANRVVVFDASWNPSHDLQSIFRVYRFGQKKVCYIYRFLAEATMEEKIYKRQVAKLSLAHRVVDEHQIERHYSMMNLHELYSFEPTPPEKWKTPRVPQDRVLGELLKSYRHVIVGYHEHDSLLENREEENLPEEERQAAWQEFEAEKEQAQHPAGIQLLPGIAQNVVPHMQQFVVSPWQNVEQRQIITNIPRNTLERGLALGLFPTTGESPNLYLARILEKEIVMRMNN